MLFPEERFSLGGVAFFELFSAYRSAPTPADRTRLVRLTRDHVREIVMTGDLATLLDQFNDEKTSEEWRGLVRTLLLHRAERRDLLELHVYYKRISCSERTADLIVELCVRLSDNFDDWVWAYEVLDESDARLDLVYEKLQALASKSLSDALRFVEQIVLQQACEEERSAALNRAWESMQPHVTSTDLALDVWKRFQAFGAEGDLLDVVIHHAIECLTEPRDTARLWALDDERYGENIFRQTLVHSLMETYPSWTIEQWVDVLSVGERLCTLLEPVMEEFFYPKLTQFRDALDACYRVKGSVCERAFSLAIQIAHTLQDWQSVIAAVENGVVEPHEVAPHRTHMRNAAQTADDWLSILHWPRADESDRAMAVQMLRELLEE